MKPEEQVQRDGRLRWDQERLLRLSRRPGGRKLIRDTLKGLALAGLHREQAERDILDVLEAIANREVRP